MSRKSYLTFIFAAVILMAAQIAVYSQFAPVNGTVVLQKADGKPEPVAGALIEVYRTDMKGGFDPVKTNKKGEFNFVGFPYGAEYVFSVSALDCAPMIFPNVKAGQERLVITMNPGDGRKWSEAEVRKGVSVSAKSGDSGSAVATDDEKKAQADFEKKNAEISAKNEKIKGADAIAVKSNAEGNAALKAENYDLAIAKFSEGIAAVPDFIGSTPILLNGKMIALKAKGFKLYKEGATSADATLKKAKYEEANKAYDDALAAFQEAVAVIKRAEATTDAAEQKRRDTLRSDLYAAATEIHRLKVVGGVDLTKAADANAVITDYIALEADPAKKLATQMVLGDIMRLSSDFEKAIAAYRQVLVLKPDHAEAMGKLGLTLFAQGASMTPEDKEMEQEGLNYMQRYIDTAPVSATDSPAEKELKMSIKESVDYLKSQKMAPQKVTPAQKVTAVPRKKG